MDRLLVVKLSALGDVVQALPVATLLRRLAPSAVIAWAVEVRYCALVAAAPEIDHVVALPDGWPRVDLGSGVRALRAARCDLAIDLQGNLRSGLATRLSRAPDRVGFQREALQERANLLFTNRRPAPTHAFEHAAHRMLALAAAALGHRLAPSDLADAVPRLHLDARTSREATEHLEALLGHAYPRLAVHPGTTWASKRMDPRFWATVITDLRETFPRLGVALSWGDARERDDCARIRDEVGDAAVVLPRLDLPVLAAVQGACDAALGPDTGPMHLAAAAGTVTVTVFRGSDPRRTAPLGAGHRVVRAPCEGCRRTCRRDAACRASVEPSAVTATLRDVMSVAGTAR